MRLKGLVSVITGAAAGIGRATAELFAEEGSTVVVVDIETKGGEETAEKIRQKGGAAIFVQVDIEREQECRDLADFVVLKFGRVDCLVNNAALFVLKGFSASMDEWKKSFGVNVFGTVSISKYISEKMKEQKSGSIVNLGSVSAHIAQPELSCYASTKATIVGLTRNMAMDLAPYNIRVNSVSPGSVFTAASSRHASALNMSIEDFKAQHGNMCVMKRMADPKEIAAPIVFLSSSDASFITGTDLLVDGGYCLP